MLKRISYWDNLKCLLIILVVVGHFIEPTIPRSVDAKRLWLFIYIFHMPLFIFIAGYFHRNRKIVEKIYLYVMLGLLTKFLLFLPELLWGTNAKLSFFSTASIPWFMFAMALFIGSSYVLRNLNGRMVLMMSIIVALFTGYDNNIKDFLVLSRYLVFFPFYWAGFLMQGINIPQRLSETSLSKIMGVLIIGGAFYLCFIHLNDFYHFRPYFTGRNPYGWHREAGSLVRFIAYLITTGMCFALLALCPKRHIPFLTTIGSRSLQIYFWHQLVRNVAIHYGILSYLSDTTTKVVYVLLAVLLTFILGMKPFGFPVVTLRKLCLGR